MYSELHDGFTAMYGELYEGFTAMYGELYDGFAEVYGELYDANHPFRVFDFHSFSSAKIETRTVVLLYKCFIECCEYCICHQLLKPKHDEYCHNELKYLQ